MLVKQSLTSGSFGQLAVGFRTPQGAASSAADSMCFAQAAALGKVRTEHGSASEVSAVFHSKKRFECMQIWAPGRLRSTLGDLGAVVQRKVWDPMLGS